MEPNINCSLLQEERVTSTYAEIYLDDDNYHVSNKSDVDYSEIKCVIEHEKEDNKWISPSDLLIDIIKLHPPFTSKITRGKTHEGILAIGNEVLGKEKATFSKSLDKLLSDNDASWEYILKYEKREVIKKVKLIYQNIFRYKSNIMKNEITIFYENTLRDLESHLRLEVHTILQSTYASVISDLNNQIQEKLLQEREKLERVLQKQYSIKVEKVKEYYSLLLHNELYRYNKLINKAIHEKNEAMRSFYKQIESQRITSTMYVLSLERKKCKIQKMLLEKLHLTEILNKIQSVKDKSNIIDELKEKHVGIAKINEQWEQNIEKILQLFQKFLSFSLKIIPEQSSFLMCMEEMVTLHLNEIQKKPNTTTNILISEEMTSNIFKFEEPEQESVVCDQTPFVIVSDLSDPVIKQFESRETLPSDEDLPYFTVGRQFIYAKCHGFENIKNVLESQKCKCRLPPPKIIQETSDTKIEKIETESSTSFVKHESSLESMILDDIQGCQDCPVRKCSKWIERYSFPDLASYLDYSEENYKRVTAILNTTHQLDSSPSVMNPKSIAYADLPFAATKEPFHNVGTQYSSQVDLGIECVCPCIENKIEQISQYSSNHDLEEIFAKRKRSLKQLIRENPNLFIILADECFDYKL